MPEDDLTEEIRLLQELERKEVKTFMRFYQLYSPDLLIQAYCLLYDSEMSQTIVDELFEKLLKENLFAGVQPPIQVFLFDEMRKLCKMKFPLLYNITNPKQE